MPDKNAVFCSAVRISLRLYVACGTLSLLVLEKAGQHKYSNHQRGLLLNQLYHLMQMNKWKTFLENLGCYFFRNCFTPLCRGQHNNKTALGLISAFTPNFRAKVIIEKSRGGRFLWNRNWDLGRFGNFWGLFFHVFMGKKKFLKTF